MGMKISKKDVFRRVYRKCIDCIYDPLDMGTTRSMVKGCTHTDCELWPIRLGVYGEFYLDCDTCSNSVAAEEE